MRGRRWGFTSAASLALVGMIAAPAAAGKPASGGSATYSGSVAIADGYDVKNDGYGEYAHLGGQFVTDSGSDSLSFTPVDPRAFAAAVRWSDGTATSWTCTQAGKATSTIVVSGGDWAATGGTADAVLSCGADGRQYEVQYGTPEQPLCVVVATTSVGWRFTTAAGCGARVYASTSGSKRKTLVGSAQVSFELLFTKG